MRAGLTRKVRESIADLKESGGLLDSEKGTRFFHRHLSPKAKAKRKARRKMRRRSRSR